MDVLGGAAFQRLESALNAATTRHNVLSNNIANVDVPYFKRSDVVFEELLARTIKGSGVGPLSGKLTHPKHIPINNTFPTPYPETVTNETSSINNNQNNVDIEKEMALLAENQLRYNLLVQQINHEVKMMRTGIEGRV